MLELLPHVKGPFTTIMSRSPNARVTQFWERYLGCPHGTLFSSPLTVLEHGSEFVGYAGIFALFHADTATISFPSDRMMEFHSLLPTPPITPASFAEAFRSHASAVIGPAVLSYTEVIADVTSSARPIVSDDAAAVDELGEACDPVEWEHGGPNPTAAEASGVFVGNQLVCLATCDIWENLAGNLSVITHPRFRRRGYAKDAVAHLARKVLSCGVLPQYRALQSNTASCQLGRALGFVPFATSVGIRL